ncbi:MAG TPA: DUF58 domain-containing protein [Gemmatimonadales bacterium]|nr:DUF58 domain-containing protein [Gemmatimonadales bacterium]
MILFTRRALYALAVLSGLAIVAYWLPWAGAVMVLLDVVVVGLAVADAFWSVPLPGVLDEPGVGVKRVPPAAITVGHPTEVSYVWTNAGVRAARVRIRETRPDLVGGTLPPRAIVIPAGGQTVERLTLLGVHRGHDEAGEMHLDSIGPLGLGVVRRRIALPWDVTVFPPLVSLRLRASVAQALRKRDAGMKPIRRLGEGRFFESLREWVPGDDLRHIDWKATARRRKVITRQYEEERRQQLLLVMDTGRLMTADVAGIARLDYAVQAALELAYAAVQHDDNVGVMSFADGVKHYVAPGRGQAGLKRVLDVLTILTPSMLEPDYPGAFRYLAARNRKRALTVVFTDLIDRTASEALVANLATLRPRHLPLAVTLRNPELDLVATTRPEDVRDAYRRAAAEELLRAREEALGHLRRAGVLVLDVPPARAAQAVVREYLELKRRGRL